MLDPRPGVAPILPLPSRQQIEEHRVLLVTGKGGVGRTTVAAAVARAAARLGRRVLLAEMEEPSTYDASPLATHFGKTVFRNRPQRIGKGIHGVMLESERGTELFLNSLFKVPALSRLALRTPALRHMLHAGPSFHEMGLFYHLLHHLQDRRSDDSYRYELVVIDMPATGHTLALTGLPAILLRLISRGPIAEAMRQGQAILNDPSRSAAWVVTLPEPLPVSECLELLDGLDETDIPIGAVVANRVPRNPFSHEEWRVLDDIVDGRRFRGLTMLDRLRRTGGSMARLERGTDIPLIQLAETDAADRDEALARMLVEGEE